MVSGKSMVKLVNDILDYSKMESEKIYLVFDPFDVVKEVSEIVGNYEALNTKPLTLTVEATEDVPRIVKGDRLRFHQVISNLIDNAVKFTNEGYVKITISIAQQSEKDIILRFVVEDTGIGIKDEDVKKLFTPFSQLDQSLTKRFKGTGLGLAICKRLVELMHGEITVESTYNKGTKITFTVSFKKTVETTRRGDNKIPEGKVEKKSNLRAINPDVHILVAEDNPVNQNVVMRVLKRLGYKNVTMVENGKEAVDKVSVKPDVDIILMDIQMPVMNGYEATGKIRKMGKKLPIIAMTANALTGDAEKCINAGMNDYISKPIDIHLFAAMLNHWSASISP